MNPEMLLGRLFHRSCPDVLRLSYAQLVSGSEVVPTGKRRVALVSMPFGFPSVPPIGLILISEILRQEGHLVDNYYFHLELAASEGLTEYDRISRSIEDQRLTGEWAFSDSVITPGSGSLAEHQALYETSTAGDARRFLPPDLQRLRSLATDAMTRWQQAVDWGRYDVVGFTLHAQQQNASLRLAHYIKTCFSGVRVVLGGPSLAAPMGQAVARRYPWLDGVFIGPAEQSFPAYVETLPALEDPVVSYDGAPIDLNRLPILGFDDYFRWIDALGLGDRIRVFLPLETTRGCWWGKRNPCVFCGEVDHRYRIIPKSRARVLEEVKKLRRYGRDFWVTESCFPPQHCDTLCQEMAAKGIEFSARLSTRSDLSRRQLEGLAAAGVRALQPGIESLSSSVLEAMGKGITAIQNVWFLRAAEELGLRLYWNFLWGVPGERQEQYVQMRRLLPLLAHLPPPKRARPINPVRFSRLCSGEGARQFSTLRATPAHRIAFGDHPLVDEFAFHFELAAQPVPSRAQRECIEAIQRWRISKSRVFAPRCEIFVSHGRRWLFDTRPDQTGRWRLPRVRLVSASEWRLLAQLESPVPEADLCSGASPAARATLQRLAQEGLILNRDGCWVRLVVVRLHPELGAELRRVLKAKRAEWFRGQNQVVI